MYPVVRKFDQAYTTGSLEPILINFENFKEFANQLNSIRLAGAGDAVIHGEGNVIVQG
jgi:hypothetical protein